MNITDNRGRQTPFFIESFSYEHIATADFDPITNLPTTLAGQTAAKIADAIGIYTQKGFLVRPNTTGLLYGITWRQWIDNKKSLTGLIPQAFLGLANTWIECPYVKVYAANNGTYPTASSYCNVAPL